jgi:hypothetical protein
MRALWLLVAAGLLAWWAWPQLAPRLPALREQAAAVQPKAEPPVRCRTQAGSLQYRQGRCEADEREEAMKGGTLSVVAAPAAAASQAASAQPLLRQLSDPAGTAEMQRKAQERMEGATR